MHGCPDAKNHSNDASAQYVKGASSRRTSFPALHYVRVVAEYEGAHFDWVRWLL